jgi:hypothetical protein
MSTASSTVSVPAIEGMHTGRISLRLTVIENSDWTDPGDRGYLPAWA